MNLNSRGYKAALTALLLLCCKLCPLASAQTVEQDTVQAAMTLQILSFTEWPEGSIQPGEKLRVGVYGNVAAIEAFRALIENPRYRERYELVPVDGSTPGELLESLHALFFSEANPAEVPRIARRTEGQPVVLIGAHDGFLEQGGLVNLVKRQRRMGFEIDLAHSRAHGIVYRAKLLRLATRIIEE